MARAPMFTAVQEDGDSLVTFYEGPDRLGAVLAFWFRASGSVLTVDFDPLGQSHDINEAGRLVSRHRNSTA